MRHRQNKLLEINTGIVKKDIYIRTMLSNLIKNGKTTTTIKRAKVLKAQADYFFSTLVRMNEKYEAKDARRECIRFIKENTYGEEIGKKVINTLLPKYLESGNKSSFVADYKMGYRSGDGAAKVMLKLL